MKDGSSFPSYVGGGDLWEEPIPAPDPWYLRHSGKLIILVIALGVGLFFV